MVTVTDLTPSCGDNPQEGIVNTDAPTFRKGTIYIGPGFYPVLSSKCSFLRRNNRPGNSRFYNRRSKNRLGIRCFCPKNRNNETTLNYSGDYHYDRI